MRQSRRSAPAAKRMGQPMLSKQGSEMKREGHACPRPPILRPPVRRSSKEFEKTHPTRSGDTPPVSLSEGWKCAVKDWAESSALFCHSGGEYFLRGKLADARIKSAGAAARRCRNILLIGNIFWVNLCLVVQSENHRIDLLKGCCRNNVAPS